MRREATINRFPIATIYLLASRGYSSSNAPVDDRYQGIGEAADMIGSQRPRFDVPFRLLDRFRIDLESMIHRFWNGFHFWLRPILDRFLIDCWSILNCIFSFLQKSRKHAQNAKRTGHSSQFFVHEKRTFPFSEYHINAFKLAVYFTRNVDLPFNVWSFWIDCWTPSAIENNSHETHPKNQHSAHGKNRIFKCIFVRLVEWKNTFFINKKLRKNARFHCVLRIFSRFLKKRKIFTSTKIFPHSPVKLQRRPVIS